MSLTERPSIFTPQSKHKPSPEAFNGSVVNIHDCQPFTNPTYLGHLKTAMNIIETKHITNRKCNEAYARRAQGVYAPLTLKQLWNNSDIWICFTPSRSKQKSIYGAWINRTGSDARYIGIMEQTLKLGAERVVHALLHEYGHVLGFEDTTGVPEALACDCGIKCFLKDHKPLKW